VTDLESPEADEDDIHHLAAVRRLRDGEIVVASDGLGAWRACRVVGAGPSRFPSGHPGRRRHSLALEADGPIERTPAPLPAIVIGYSLAKGERTEWAAAKLAELGVDRIIPLVCDRTVVRPGEDGAARRTERLRRIVREAAMQARLLHLPEVSEPLSFEGIVTAEEAAPISIAEPGGAAPALERPMLLIGPEGGWSEVELSIAAAHRLAKVTLSPHVLRIETAAVAGATLLTALRDHLVSSP
jgi:16S rRNA (uracil1498-N3)-methyltransferase